MRWLLDFFINNPIAIVGVIWLFGAIGNVIKRVSEKGSEPASKVRRQGAARVKDQVTEVVPIARSLQVKPEAKSDASFVGGLGSGERGALPSRRKATKAMQSPSSAAARGRKLKRSPDEIAAEMRRLLGLQQEPAQAPTPAPVVPETPEPEVVIANSRPQIRAVSDVMMSSIESHVGEGMRDRHMAKTEVGHVHGSRGSIGNLGGRVTASTAREVAKSRRRYAINDLKQAIIMSEIVSPPVTMRESHLDRPL
jgi:hypothetical protein